MKEQQTSTQPPKQAASTSSKNEQLTLDLLRASFFGNIFKWYLEVLKKGDLPPETNRNVLEQTLGQTGRFEREVRRVTHGKDLKIYLNKNLKEEKLLDMITIMDLMARVGVEERQDTYEELLGLIVDLVDKVFYAQNNRRNLHFGKYKALFKLISDEMRRDVNRQPGQILFTNKGELFLRTAAPENETEIK